MCLLMQTQLRTLLNNFFHGLSSCSKCSLRSLTDHKLIQTTNDMQPSDLEPAQFAEKLSDERDRNWVGARAFQKPCKNHSPTLCYPNNLEIFPLGLKNTTTVIQIIEGTRGGSSQSRAIHPVMLTLTSLRSLACSCWSGSMKFCLTVSSREYFTSANCR